MKEVKKHSTDNKYTLIKQYLALFIVLIQKASDKRSSNLSCISLQSQCNRSVNDSCNICVNQNVEKVKGQLE